MSAFRVRKVETIDLTMDDDLDVVMESGPVASATAMSSAANDGRALRTRHSLGNTIIISPKQKRARTFSESTIENHEQVATGKRQKREDKKAVGLPLFPER
jgi:hypothetical protein